MRSRPARRPQMPSTSHRMACTPCKRRDKHAPYHCLCRQTSNQVKRGINGPAGLQRLSCPRRPRLLLHQSPLPSRVRRLAASDVGVRIILDMDVEVVVDDLVLLFVLVFEIKPLPRAANEPAQHQARTAISASGGACVHIACQNLRMLIETCGSSHPVRHPVGLFPASR